MSKNETPVVSPQQKPTRGTQLGEELRAASNSLSDERRQELRSIAMAIIHGGNNKRVTVRR